MAKVAKYAKVSPVPTRNVNLTDEQDSYVDGLIRSGRYQNASEALRDAVRALRQRISGDELKLELLRGQVKAGADAIARVRYRDLPAAALRTIASAPDAPPTVARAPVLPGLRSLHLRAARGRRKDVREPVHAVFFLIEADGSVAVLRVLHDRMDPSRRFPGA